MIELKQLKTVYGSNQKSFSISYTKKGESSSSNFRSNGSLVLEELIGTFGERYKLPLRNFSAKELITASNNLSEKLHGNMTNIVDMYRGNLKGRPVLLKFWNRRDYPQNLQNYVIRDVVVNSQMSHHKNVLKLIGCSLEMEYPAMVYEYAGTKLLSDCLCQPNDDTSLPLPMRSRIKIARDIGNVLLYLHTAFATPIIHRDIKLGKVIIDQCGVAKLFDFTTSISLPPGELQVLDNPLGTFGYLDPQYCISGFVTQKTDVYCFGILMLVLLTGRTRLFNFREEIGGRKHIRDYCKDCLENDHFNQILDPTIFESEGNGELRKILLEFLYLALRCTENEGVDRPDMIDVAKELLRIEKSVRHFF